MMSKRKVIVSGGVIAVLVVAAVLWRARSVTAAQIVRNAKSAWARLNSYQGTATISVNMGGMSMSVKTDQWYQKPDKVRMDIDMQYFKQSTVRNGNELISYLPQFGKALRMRDLTAAKKSGAASCNCMGDFVNDLKADGTKYRGRTEVAGRSCRVLETSGGQLVDRMKECAGGCGSSPMTAVFKDARIRLAIDDEYQLPMKFTLIDKKGKEIISQTFETFQPNVTLPADTFTPSFAKGLEVVDVDPSNPASIAAALQPKPKEVTVEQAKREVAFRLNVPATLGEPQKVAIKAAGCGQKAALLTWEVNGKSVTLEEVDVRVAIPFARERQMPGVKVVKVGAQEIAVGGQFPGANPKESHVTWQSRGVDYTLRSDTATEGELVTAVKRMLQSSPEGSGSTTVPRNQV